MSDYIFFKTGMIFVSY